MWEQSHDAFDCHWKWHEKPCAFKTKLNHLFKGHMAAQHAKTSHRALFLIQAKLCCYTMEAVGCSECCQLQCGWAIRTRGFNKQWLLNSLLRSWDLHNFLHYFKMKDEKKKATKEKDGMGQFPATAFPIPFRGKSRKQAIFSNVKWESRGKK